MYFPNYRSVLGKCPWALKHNSRFWPAWALSIWDINSIHLYRSCYIDPLKCHWVLTLEWALAQDTTAWPHRLSIFLAPSQSLMKMFNPYMYIII